MPKSGVLIVSELDLGAEFDDAVGWQSEEGGCAARIAEHRDEDLLAPELHFRSEPGNKGFPAKEVGRVHGIEVEAVFETPLECRRN